ncbi:hypothetical protein [Thalassotalea maritima]|uniref:isopeptide-forming domain-containing fimbrial protein n=1 Tax=Thalassotalea maritima TaxID=3242416 RepID=UPI0035283DC3
MFTSQLVHARTPVELRDELSWAGHGNFIGTGGTFRDIIQGADAGCAFLADDAISTGTLYGMPNGATVAKAHLTWAASGPANDYDVTFNGVNVSADFGRRYVYENTAENISFYSGSKDVTQQVSAAIGTANGGTYNFSFAGLTIEHTDTNYCNGGRAFGGWSLIVIYELASEPLRLVNVFEGFDSFWGSSLLLQPKNFRVPDTLPAGVNLGKHAHITWEGDPQINTDRDGFSESLLFQGTTLSYGTVNPSGGQYNATIADDTLSGTTVVYNTYGLDLDIYDITSYVSPGLTQVDTVYEAGQDRVYLSSEVLSIVNVEVTDLEVNQGISTREISSRGEVSDIRINIDNNGPYDTSGDLTVTITLNNDLSLFGSNSFSSNGWSCLQSITNAMVVNCTKTVNYVNGAMDYIDIPVSVATDAAITQQVTVSIPGTLSDPYPISGSGGRFDNITSNNTKTFTYNLLAGDLSTSTKQGLDDNAGAVEVGDSITYTIRLSESAGYGIANVTVTDQLPIELENLSIISIPPGATNNTTGNQLDISNIFVKANQSVDIIYRAHIVNTVAPDTVITNIANIASPEMSMLSVQDSLTVIQLNPINTVKQLYLWGENDKADSAMSDENVPNLSRLAPTESQGNIDILTVTDNQCLFDNPNADNCKFFTLDPRLSSDFTIDEVMVDLYVDRITSNQNKANIGLALVDATNQIIASYNLDGSAKDVTLANQISLMQFPLTLEGGVTSVTVSSNDTNPNTLKLLIQNNHSSNSFRITPYSTEGISQVRIDTQTVINIDSINFYDVAHNDNQVSNVGGAVTNIEQGDIIYGRAIVSDPFGAFDISNVDMTLLDSNGNIITELNNLVKKSTNQVPDLNTGQVMVEFSYVLANDAPLGMWQAQIRAEEGLEGTVWDIDFGTFNVYVPPELTVTKQVFLKASPGLPVSQAQIGDLLQYQILISNQSLGDAVNLAVTESISPYTAFLFTSDLVSDDSLICLDCDAVGISYSEPNFSNDGGSSYLYSPVVGANTNGHFVDTNITNFNLELSGTLKSGENITFTYDVVVQ